MSILSESHLRKILQEYSEFYNNCRPHQGHDMCHNPPVGRIILNHSALKMQRLGRGMKFLWTYLLSGPSPPRSPSPIIHGNGGEGEEWSVVSNGFCFMRIFKHGEFPEFFFPLTPPGEGDRGGEGPLSKCMTTPCMCIAQR
jgi:hypothetical protein